MSGLTYRHMPRVGAKTEQAWDRLGSLTVIKVLDIPAWDAVCDLGHRRLVLSLALELLNVTTPRARVAGQRPSPPAPARRPDHSDRPQVHYSRRQHLQRPTVWPTVDSSSYDASSAPCCDTSENSYPPLSLLSNLSSRKEPPQDLPSAP